MGLVTIRSMLTLMISVGVFSFVRATDVVELENGDRISGEVQNLEGGSLVVATSYAGNVKIRWDQVRMLTTEQELVVDLASGMAAVGRIVPVRNLTVRIENERPREVALAEIVRIRKDEPPEEPPGFFRRWSGTADLGYSVTRGNRDLDNLSFTVRPELETDRHRTRLNLRALRSVQDGVSARSLYQGQLRHEYFFSPRAFVFGLTGIEQDIQQGLDLRTTQGAGFGYQIRPRPGTRISIFGGVNFIQEAFDGLERDLGGEGSAGYEIETDLFGPLHFSSRGQILPLFTDGRYRVDVEAAVRVPLFMGFTLGVQVFDRFDSNPPREGVLRNDVGLVSTFGINF